MKIINNILKSLVYLINLLWIFYNSFWIILAFALFDFDIEDIPFLILQSILVILYIYLTYLFYKNIVLSNENTLRIIKISIINIIISIINIIISGIIYTLQCKSIYIIFTGVFFVFYCLPIVILLISIKFNELYMKKLKD
ncbi:MAG: hypothetical protein ACLUG9_16845 [Paraclostridium sordellii]